MHGRKCRRREPRHQVSQINPIQLSSPTGEIFFVVPVDASDSGMGCIYSGKTPPQVGKIHMVSENGGTREMEVRWVTPIGKKRFRLGLMYLDLKLMNSTTMPSDDIVKNVHACIRVDIK